MAEKKQKNTKPNASRLKPQSRKLPLTILEVQPGFILAASLSSARRPCVRRIGVAGLDAGIVTPSPLQLNIAETEVLASKLREAAKAVRARKGDAALLLPDAVVRVSVLAFETLPAKEKEREALIGWRIKDTLGFPPEQASLSYQVMAKGSGNVEVLVAAVKTEILEQYEKILSDGVVLALPATMALLPLLPEDGAGAQLLVHRCAGWITNAVVTGHRLRFWRSRPVASNGINSGAADILSEVARAKASVRDRLGVEISRGWYCGRAVDESDFAEQIGRELGVPVERLPWDSGIEGALSDEERALLGSFGAPIAGLIANRGSLVEDQP
jgi:hypothetical protein